ncbi:WRKY transcription factor 55-like [Macadamia integrifolia]|uniref:WRKY transcription factor 55-like n=1 Tax=Macadamia integrifolia TaxID=60698 RepID=UPI001C4E3415|nr:WRKY transcription factor 55-like [Macadamia integrifolia]
MEEILSLIFRGCNLTRDLESKLPSLTNNPSLLASSCDDIVRAFSRASDLLKAQGPPQPPPPPELEAGGVQEWLTTSHTQAMAVAMLALDPFQGQLFSDKNPFDVRLLTTREAEGGSSSSVRARGGGELQGGEGSDAGKSPVTQQRSRKRKDGEERHTIRAAAPRIGNTEIPPDDGFTWRKYGQKEILGSRFPRSYYRCTHKSFYGCNARKQVQRLDDDPNTFEVTYCGHHTCLMSSPTSSMPPPQPPVATTTGPEPPLEVEATQHPLPTSPPTRRRHSMELESDTPTELGLRMPGSFNVAGSVSLSTTAATTTQAPGPSEPSQPARDGREVEWPVADLADVMFNSGSSSSEMDLFFGPM